MATMRPTIILMAMLVVVASHCPYDKWHVIGNCAFRIQCYGTIENASLFNVCRGSSNYPAVVTLTLVDAQESIDDKHIDSEFLAAVTDFTAIARWPHTSIPILKYMPRLKKLRLSNNHIRKIEGNPFYQLNSLESIDLSRNNLCDISDLFKFEDSNRLEEISLAHNNINELQYDVFEELILLVELDLSNNELTDLTQEPFANLTSLEVLRLNNNKIKDLNGAVNNLNNLKHLYLRGNEIDNIDEESHKIIYHLKTFDISGNKLEKLKPVLFWRHWKHLHNSGNTIEVKIILSENQITSVPNVTSKELLERFGRHLVKKIDVEVLTELDLSKNQLTNIEYNAFQSIIHLTSLDLSCNRLITFVVNAEDLANIKYLNLSSNYIYNLYFDSFSSMTNLENLDLSHNKLYDIPDHTFKNNNNLMYVNMTDNEIHNVEHFRMGMFNPKGGVLDLSNNDLSTLKIPNGEGFHLNMLILTSNNISDPSLIDLKYLSELKDLDMSKNMIEYLDETSLRLPSRLVNLDLSHNQIVDIGPSTFEGLGHLTLLRLTHNRLSRIQYGTFYGLTALVKLDLSYNQIVSLDSTLLMDLKFLNFLSLRHNGLHYLNYDGWLGHNYYINVFLDGNDFDCEWLSRALNDFHNGYSKMSPSAFVTHPQGHSVEGIPCQPTRKENLQASAPTHADERLLITNQKILQAIKYQTYILLHLQNLTTIQKH